MPMRYLGALSKVIIFTGNKQGKVDAKRTLSLNMKMVEKHESRLYLDFPFRCRDFIQSQ